MPHVRASARITPLLITLCIAQISRADEDAILHEVREFFAAENLAQRTQTAARITADPAFDRSRVSEWLHQACEFEPLETGRRRIRVKVGDRATLPITLRIPAGYDPKHPYPLIYALHGMGGNADGIIGFLEHLLGERIERYVVAAPTGYTQSLIHSTTPPADEHPAALLAVRKAVHVDSNRVYAVGYSRGGHTAWTLAVTHPDQFAAVIPIAGTLVLADHGKLFETFLPNIANTRVFACWGENDVMSADYTTPGDDGGIAGLNHRLCELAVSLDLPLKWYEVPGGGHGDITPPLADVEKLLATEREPYPRKIRRVFRLPCQGDMAWIEAHAWRGSWWDQNPLKISFRRDENPNQPETQLEARARAIRGRLGELRGEVAGQHIKVYRKKISELTVWVGDGMIDWDQPVKLTVNGRDVFEDRLAPDLLICLTQAARTRDLDRLRWAGLRFKSGSRTRVVTGETPFPPTPVTPD